MPLVASVGDRPAQREAQHHCAGQVHHRLYTQVNHTNKGNLPITNFHSIDSWTITWAKLGHGAVESAHMLRRQEKNSLPLSSVRPIFTSLFVLFKAIKFQVNVYNLTCWNPQYHKQLEQLTGNFNINYLY